MLTMPGAHFTGKERDAESGNDYFGARYYASTMGRMLSPDSLGGDIGNPQTLNRYSYALNNPLVIVDPSGQDCVYINNDTNAFEGFNTGDCNNSDPYLANTGHFIDTVNQIQFGSQGQVFGFSGTDETGNSASESISGSGNAQVFNWNPYSNTLTSSEFGQTFNVTANASSGLQLDPNAPPPPQATIGPWQPAPPPPPPGTFECLTVPTEAMQIHAAAMAAWRQQNGLPPSSSAASDDDTGGSGVSGTYLSMQNRNFYVGNRGYKLKPSPLSTVPNANVRGAAGANAAAMAADYATSATGCLVSK